VLLIENRKAGRRLVWVALCVIALGTTLVGAGTASAAIRTGHYAHIKFYNKQRVVTMSVPTQCPPVRQAPCVWMLYVNEPENPAQTVVGTQSAAPQTKGILQVAYPRNFCGVIQADVVVGPSPWLFETGRVRQIDTFQTTGKGHYNLTQYCPPGGGGSPPPGGGTTQPKPPGSGGGNGQGGNAQASSLPFTATTTAGSGSSGTSAAADGPSTATTATAGTLPFTGLDVKPLALAGAVLILFGLFILTSLEQRRRALRRVGSAVSTGAAYSSRASHWFLGD
jgi:hypothetical protein